MPRTKEYEFKKNIRFKSSTFYLALIIFTIIFLTNILYIVIFFSNNYLNNYYFLEIDNLKNEFFSKLVPDKFMLIGNLAIACVFLFLAFAFFVISFLLDRKKIGNISVWCVLTVATTFFIISAIFFSISEQNYKKVETIYLLKINDEKQIKFFKWKSIEYIWFMNIFKVCTIIYIYTIINNDLCALSQTEVQTILKFEANSRLNILQNNKRFVRRFVAPTTSNILFWIICYLFLLLLPIFLFIFLTLTNNGSVFEIIKICYCIPGLTNSNDEQSINVLVNSINVGMIFLAIVVSIYFVFIINVHKDNKIEFIVVFLYALILFLACIALIVTWFIATFFSEKIIINWWNGKIVLDGGSLDKLIDDEKILERIPKICNILNIKSIQDNKLIPIHFKWLDKMQLFVFHALNLQYFIVVSIIIFCSLWKNNNILKKNKITKFFEKKYFS